MPWLMIKGNDSDKGKVSMRINFLCVAEMEKFELDQLSNGILLWLVAKWQVALYGYAFEP